MFLDDFLLALRRLAPTVGTAICIAILGPLLSGCGYSFFAAKTTASYEITPDGVKRIFYESDKEHVGLDVTYEVDEKGNVKRVLLKVDKSGAQESATAAAQAAMARMMEALVPLLNKLASQTAGSR